MQDVRSLLNIFVLEYDCPFDYNLSTNEYVLAVPVVAWPRLYRGQTEVMVKTALLTHSPFTALHLLLCVDLYHRERKHVP